MKVLVKLYLEVKDEDIEPVVAAGGRSIQENWGDTLDEFYKDDDKPLLVGALYELITAGMWRELDKHKSPDMAVELINSEFDWWES